MNFLDKMGLRDILGIQGSAKIDLIDRFPGSLAEYNDFTGTKHKIMDTGRPEKYIVDTETKLFEELIAQGCVALVRYNLDWGPHSGIPVKKNNETPHN